MVGLRAVSPSCSSIYLIFGPDLLEVGAMPEKYPQTRMSEYSKPLHSSAVRIGAESAMLEAPDSTRRLFRATLSASERTRIAQSAPNDLSLSFSPSLSSSSALQHRA